MDYKIYELEVNPDYSGGKGLMINKETHPFETGTADHAFTGREGVYDISITYVDESEPLAPIDKRFAGYIVEIIRDGSAIHADAWTADQQLGFHGINKSTLIVRHVEDVVLKSNDVIRIKGTATGGVHAEHARLDCLVITPANEPRPFFPMDNGFGDVPSLEDQAVLLKELGYAGICTRPKSSTPELLAVFDRHGLAVAATYVTLSGKEATVPGHVVKHLELLKGRGTIVWLMLKDEDASDAEAVGIIRKVVDLAAANELPVVLYAHVACRTSTVKECDRLRELAIRPGLGVSFSLCHFLRQNEDEVMEETIRSVAPDLKLVQINGANDVPQSTTDWDELIKPLGEGDLDVGRVLRTLDEVGYTGPVNLQCYRVPPPARKHLETSMNAWKQYHE